MTVVNEIIDTSSNNIVSLEPVLTQFTNNQLL